MARYTGSVCRLCRREGMKLFLKGDRCFTEKCAIEKRNYAPGQHGTGGRNNLGRKTARHRGGGHKRRYRVVDFRRNKDGVPELLLGAEDGLIYRMERTK